VAKCESEVRLVTSFKMI